MTTTDRVIIVRESEWREMREALSDIASGSYSGVLLTSYPPKDPAVERARAALAKSEAAVGQPVAHAYVVAGECEQIEWGTDAALPDDPALVWLYPHPTPDGCGREGKQIEAAARAIADAWGETWECCCTEQRGLDCDCGDAMPNERERYDERLSREDCRVAARAALSALTAGRPEQAVSSGPIEATDRDALTAALVALTRHGIAPDIQELLLRGNPDLGVRPGALTAAIRATNDRRCVEVDDG